MFFKRHLATLLFAGAHAVFAHSAATQDVSAYWVYYPLDQDPAEYINPPGFPPVVRVVGGTENPPPTITPTGSYEDIGRFLHLTGWLSPYGVGIDFITIMNTFDRVRGGFLCVSKYDYGFPFPVLAGTTLVKAVAYAGPCDDNPGSPPGMPETPTMEWLFQDQMRFGNTVRRIAIDGSTYEAAPLHIIRNGYPWVTYYAGYRLGMVASEANWVVGTAPDPTVFHQYNYNWSVFPTANDNFELVKLPPPWIEGEVTEYRNTVDFPKSPYGQFFYAARDEDRTLLDTQTNWTRTGRSFYSGGYVSVCRFYGSMSPGPNTHFFTASAEECDYFKNLQKTPTPTDVQQLNYEGQPFRASLPIISASISEMGVVTQQATCPTHSMPLYRAYNNAYNSEGKRDYDSNHRFSTVRSDMDVMTLHGWTNEGIVMCVPTADAQRIRP